MTQEEALGNKDTGKPLRPFQWRMDFRKSPPGTRNRSVRQTTTPTLSRGAAQTVRGGLAHALGASTTRCTLCFRVGILNSDLPGERLQEVWGPESGEDGEGRGAWNPGGYSLTGWQQLKKI